MPRRDCRGGLRSPVLATRDLAVTVGKTLGTTGSDHPFYRVGGRIQPCDTQEPVLTARLGTRPVSRRETHGRRTAFRADGRTDTSPACTS